VQLHAPLAHLYGADARPVYFMPYRRAARARLPIRLAGSVHPTTTCVSYPKFPWGIHIGTDSDTGYRIVEQMIWIDGMLGGKYYFY
jgi:hypothetical protein